MAHKKLKQAAAEAALEYIQNGDIVGVGTGSTVDCFIDILGKIKGRIDGAVASSRASAERLRAQGIELFDLNPVAPLPLYVDGTDEATRHLHLLKGGGGALTGEKIIAQASERFICIAEQRKLVAMLGTFPLPVEVIPMAQSLVGRRCTELGGQPQLRSGFTTDHGNRILDVHHLRIDNPVEMERQINQIPGVVSVGLFALRPADLLLLASEQGIETLR